MLPEENEVYGPYTLPYQQGPSESVAILHDPAVTRAHAEQDTSPLPTYAPGTPPPPRKWASRGGAILLLTLVLALTLGVGLFAGVEFAGNSTSSTATTSQAGTTATTTASGGTTIETQQEAAIAKIEPAVVELKVTTAQGLQIGSGVIIDAQGDIITNNHIVSGGQSIVAVLYNGNTEQAQLVGTVAADDLAVVRIQPFTNMTVAQVGDSSSLVVGQEVLAIGNPLGITQTATGGIVSALNRSVTESTGTTISNAIQTDAAVNPGNTETNTVANGVSFAIPSNLVQTVIQQIVK
jgi:S1-C subfamily serine protease